MQERPNGITLLAIVFIALGVLSLIWSGLVFGVGGISAMFSSLFGSGSSGTFNVWSGFLGIVAAAVQIACGVGLWMLKRWGWYLALIGAGISIVQGLFGLFSGGVFTFLCVGLGLVIPILILIYLLRPNVRAAFGV